MVKDSTCMSRRKIFNALLLALFFFGCGNEAQRVLPSNTGKHNELIVVVKDQLWGDKVRQAIQDIFAQPQAGLPQAEPVFNVVQIPKSAFSRIFKTHKNILFLEKDDSLIRWKKEAWAKDQMVLFCSAPDSLSLEELLRKNGARLLNEFTTANIARYQKRYKSIRQKRFHKLFAQRNIGLVVPKGFLEIDSAEQFTYLRREVAKIQQGILVTQQPYLGAWQFSPALLVAHRDSIGQAFVSGTLEGSYMQTYANYPVITKPISLNGHYALEMRGLWHMANDFMGGPFLSYTVLDTIAQRLVTVEGFVYAPGTTKLRSMQQLESVLRTLEFKH